MNWEMLKAAANGVIAAKPPTYRRRGLEDSKEAVRSVGHIQHEIRGRGVRSDYRLVYCIQLLIISFSAVSVRM